MNTPTFSSAGPEHNAVRSKISRNERRNKQDVSSFVYTGISIALLHAVLLACVLWLHATPAPAPHEIEIHTIDAQLISPDTAPVPVHVESRTPAVLKPLPKQQIKQQTKPLPKPTPMPTMPLQAAPSTLAPPVTPTSTATSPVPATPADSTPPEALPRATLAATAPKNVEHLECAIARPDYPALSRHNDESGTALVQIVVDTQGRIETATLKKSSTFARLDNAALQAAQSSRCRPYLENGQPIRSSALVPFRFTLDD